MKKLEEFVNEGIADYDNGVYANTSKLDYYGCKRAINRAIAGIFTQLENNVHYQKWRDDNPDRWVEIMKTFKQDIAPYYSKEQKAELRERNAQLAADKEKAGLAEERPKYANHWTRLNNDLLKKLEDIHDMDFYPLQCAEELGYEAKNDDDPHKGYTMWLFNYITKDVFETDTFGKRFQSGETQKEYEARLKKVINTWFNKVSDELIQNAMTPEGMAKLLDPAEFFDPSNPDTDERYEAAMEHLENLPYYFSSDKTSFSYKAKQIIGNWYIDPANKPAVQKCLAKAWKKMQKFRPTWDNAEKESVHDFLNGGGNGYVSGWKCYYDKVVVDLERREEEHDDPYYQGNNYRSNSYQKRALNVLNRLINKWKESMDQKEFIKRLNDVREISFKESNHHSSCSGVVSSSFWTTYYADVDADITLRGDVTEHEKFNDIVTSSDYFSGGW